MVSFCQVNSLKNDKENRHPRGSGDQMKIFLFLCDPGYSPSANSGMTFVCHKFPYIVPPSSDSIMSR